MYIAAKGGEEAIQQAEAFYQFLNGELTLDAIRTVEQKLPYLIDRVIGESSLYSPELAALAIAQTGGDLYEAVLLLRAYRTTQPRIAYAEPVHADECLTVRRISAAFKDIPGGQVLGPSLDYSHRLLRMDILDSKNTPQPDLPEPKNVQVVSPTYPSLGDWQRQQGLLEALHVDDTEPALLPDITTDTVMFPAPRAHRLQALARADTGGVLALGYSIMRGYGLIHPTVNELRLGYAEVEVKHPVTGEVFSAGRARFSQCEVVAPNTAETTYTIGFAATMGWNEVKLIAASTLDLDMATSKGEGHPAHQEEFVLYHTEPVEASGFCIHFKLPHYVTFASSLDNIRKVVNAAVGAGAAMMMPDEKPEMEAQA